MLQVVLGESAWGVDQMQWMGYDVIPTVSVEKMHRKFSNLLLRHVETCSIVFV